MLLCLMQGIAVQLPQLTGGVMTDDTVPEGHKGLHGFLYGDAGAEVHSDVDRQYNSREVSV